MEEDGDGERGGFLLLCMYILRYDCVLAIPSGVWFFFFPGKR